MGIPTPMMAHRFRVQMWDNHGTEIAGLGITTVSVIVRINEIELHTTLTHNYRDMPEMLWNAESLTITVELLDGFADQKILKAFMRTVRVTDAEMELDYRVDEPVRMVYTLETINTNLEESN